MRRHRPAGFHHALRPPQLARTGQSFRRQHGRRHETRLERERVVGALERGFGFAVAVGLQRLGGEEDGAAAAQDRARPAS